MTSRERRWLRRNERIAALLNRPDGESPEAQKARCAEWERLALARLRDGERTPYQMAKDAEREPHWWRDLSFVCGAPR